ncbi:hypothetical protein HanIR_Chr10g0461751 [Helianthus annuus]|nr:hypothetical protein HanIR_Chr10g0461751 [Helianthus annuus]
MSYVTHFLSFLSLKIFPSHTLQIMIFLLLLFFLYLYLSHINTDLSFISRFNLGFLNQPYHSNPKYRVVSPEKTHTNSGRRI